MSDTKYYVVLSNRDGEDTIETIRTSKKAAEEDVRLFSDIVRRHTWIREA